MRPPIEICEKQVILRIEEKSVIADILLLETVSTVAFVLLCSYSDSFWAGYSLRLKGA